MYDWQNEYENIHALNADIANGKPTFTKCGWYVYDNEFSLVSRITKDGKELFEGAPEEGDRVKFYAFSGRISDSVFGAAVPTIVDKRNER